MELYWLPVKSNFWIFILLTCNILCSADRSRFGRRGDSEDSTSSKVSYYETLGVRSDATSKEIKKAFRMLALRHHPDKVQDLDDKEAAEERFLVISKAHDVLGNDDLRKRYDELLDMGIYEYDEREWQLARQRKEEEYNMKTGGYYRSGPREPQDTSVAFYAALSGLIIAMLPAVYVWDKRRREIKATKKKVKKNMMTQISKEQQQQEKREKERERMVKEQREREEEEERRKEEQEEKEEKETIDPKILAQRREDKRLRLEHRRLRQIFRNACRPYWIEKVMKIEPIEIESNDSKSDDEKNRMRGMLCLEKNDVEIILTDLSLEQLTKLMQSMTCVFPGLKQNSTGSASTDIPISGSVNIKKAVSFFQKELNRIQHRKKMLKKKYDEELARKRFLERQAEEKLKKSKPWSHEELSILSKAVAKFPGGTGKRWELIARMLNNQYDGPDRNVKQIIKKIKECETKGIRLNKKDAFRAYRNAMNKPEKKKGHGNKMNEVIEGKRKLNGISKKEIKASSEEWDSVSQSALEKALRSVGKSADRWEKIAALVPGKTKKQCIRRFKEIKSQIMKKRAAATGAG